MAPSLRHAVSRFRFLLLPLAVASISAAGFAAAVAPPTITKAFGAPLATIALNGTTSLTITITNPNGSPLSGVSVTDPLPSGLVVATPNGLTSTCGGTATATAGSSSVVLTNGTLSAGGNCTVDVNVTGVSAGVQHNITGPVSSTEGGTGVTASDFLLVVAPPSITKAFGASAIPIGGTTSLTFTISNPNSPVAIGGVSVTDSLPAGLVVATPNTLSSNCGGTVTAVAGSTSFTLTNGTIGASSSCTASINVTGVSAGVQDNVTGAVSSTFGGTGNTASASVTVASAPAITKAFGSTSIPVGGTTSLTFTITNPNGTSLTGVGFTDNFPAGIAVGNPNGLTNSCGGTAAAVAGSNVVSLSGVSLAAAGSCTVSVSITGTSGRMLTNSVSVSSNEGGTSGSTSATLFVVDPNIPTLSTMVLLLLMGMLAAAGIRRL